MLGHRFHVVRRHFECLERHVSQERIRSRPEQVTYVVLQQPVGDIDVRAEQLLATGDPLDHVLPVVQDELEAEIANASARATGTGPLPLRFIEACREGRVFHLPSVRDLALPFRWQPRVLAAIAGGDLDQLLLVPPHPVSAAAVSACSARSRRAASRVARTAAGTAPQAPRWRPDPARQLPSCRRARGRSPRTLRGR